MKLTILISLICSGLVWAAPSTTKATFKQLSCHRDQTPMDGDEDLLQLTLQNDGTYTLNWKHVLGGNTPFPVTQPAPVVVQGLVCNTGDSDSRLVDCHSQTDSFQVTSKQDQFEGEQLNAIWNGKYIASFSAYGSGHSFPDFCRIK